MPMTPWFCLLAIVWPALVIAHDRYVDTNGVFVAIGGHSGESYIGRDANRSPRSDLRHLAIVYKLIGEDTSTGAPVTTAGHQITAFSYHYNFVNFTEISRDTTGVEAVGWAFDYTIPANNATVIVEEHLYKANGPINFDNSFTHVYDGNLLLRVRIKNWPFESSSNSLRLVWSVEGPYNSKPTEKLSNKRSRGQELEFPEGAEIILPLNYEEDGVWKQFLPGYLQLEQGGYVVVKFDYFSPSGNGVYFDVLMQPVYSMYPDQRTRTEPQNSYNQCPFNMEYMDELHAVHQSMGILDTN